MKSKLFLWISGIFVIFFISIDCRSSSDYEKAPNGGTRTKERYFQNPGKLDIDNFFQHTRSDAREEVNKSTDKLSINHSEKYLKTERHKREVEGPENEVQTSSDNVILKRSEDSLKEEDLCNKKPCKHGGICAMTADHKDFKCDCVALWVGKDCSNSSFCENIGKTICPGKCNHDEETGTGYCTCPEKQYYDYRNNTCKKISFCPLKNCEKDENQICDDSECKCKSGFKRDSEKKKCVSDMCSETPCPGYSMKCTNTEEYYKCSCNDGEYYNAEKKECLSSHCVPGATKCTQKCEDDKCVCYNGYELIENECKKKDETKDCDLPCEPGKCVEIDGKPKCECPWGSEGNQNSCKSACDPGSPILDVCPTKQCSSEKGNFRCNCTGAYVYDVNGITCLPMKRCGPDDEALKYCSDRRATCVPVESNKETGYKCVCPTGYFMDIGGCYENCIKQENRQKCYILNKICYEKENGTTGCECPGHLLFAEKDDSPCDIAPFTYEITLPLHKQSYIYPDVPIDFQKPSKLVRASMKLLIPEDHQVEILSWTYSIPVRDPETTLSCDVVVKSLQDVEQYINLIRTPSACMEEGDNSGLCVLGSGLVLRTAELSSISPKKADLCDKKYGLCGSHTNCNKSDDSYECMCEEGFKEYEHKYYKQNTFLSRSCKEIDVCSFDNLNDCDKESTTCINNRGDYYCKCKSGYRLEDDIDKDENNKKPCKKLCSPNPCKKGECNETGEHSFYCRCKPGITGMLCDEQDEIVMKANSKAAVVGAVLGTILGLTIIASLVIIIKMKKRINDCVEDKHSVVPYRRDGSEERNQFGQGFSNRTYDSTRDSVQSS